MSFMRGLAAACAALMLVSTAARADTVVIYQSDVPGGPWGYWGMDVMQGQSVAARFTMPSGQDLPFSRLGLYLMNNSDAVHAEVRLSLRTDQLDEGGTESLPGDTVLESWTIVTEASGWTPVQQFVQAVNAPMLLAGRNYWVVAESDAQPMLDPVWVFAASGTAWSTTTSPDTGAWQTAGEAAALTLLVEGQGDGVAAPTVSLQSGVRRIVLGASVNLIWNSSGADSCRAGGAWSGKKPVSGSQRVTPEAVGTYVYKLSCSGAGGTGSARTSVQVVAPGPR